MALDPTVSKLTDTSPLDPQPSVLGWGFTHQADLVTRDLRLMFRGTDPQKFGVPEVTDAVVELSNPTTGRYALEHAVLQDASTVTGRLRADMPAGWYDVTLILTDEITSLKRTATELGLVFGNVTRAVVAVEPAGKGFRFGDRVTLRLLEPVGRSLVQIGVTPERLQPRLRRAEDPNLGATVDTVALTAVRDRTLDFILNPRYADYRTSDPLHAIDPGFGGGIPLTLPFADLPAFQVLPIQLTAEVITKVLTNVVKAAPAASVVEPGAAVAWKVANVPFDRVANPGLDPIVFTEVKRLLQGSNASLRVDGTLGVTVRADHTGYTGPWATSVTTTSGAMHPSAVSHLASFGVLRPPVIRHGSAAPSVGTDGSLATLTLKVTASIDEPQVYSGTLSTPVAGIPTIWQLPLAIPTVAVLTDQRYEHDFSTPGGNVLVLAPGLFAGAVSTKGAESGRAAMLVNALRTLDRVLPLARRAWPQLPGSDIVPTEGPYGRKSPLGIVADWLQSAPTLTVCGDLSRSHLGELGPGNPGWEDTPSAAVVIGLPTGVRRTLRLFSERTTDASRSAYLDLRVSSGRLHGSLWTLHESVFKDGYGVRAPFTALTEPSPKWQCDSARTTSRPDMPWFLGTGYSFGNVASAFTWV